MCSVMFVWAGSLTCEDETEPVATVQLRASLSSSLSLISELSCCWTSAEGIVCFTVWEL